MADQEESAPEVAKENQLKLKYYTFVDCSETSNSTAKENETLQEAFIRFRQAKQVWFY